MLHLRLVLFLLFTCFFLGVNNVSYAQQILVPYRVGAKMGLSDMDGHLVLQPEYHSLFLHKNMVNYFIGIKLTDSFENGLKEKNYLTDNYLLHGTEVVYHSAKTSEFDIFPKVFIIAHIRDWSDESKKSYTQQEWRDMKRMRDQKVLLSITGKEIYPQNFRRLQMMRKGYNDDHELTQILFSSENFDKQYSMFSYDIAQSKIDKWLVKDANKIKILDNDLVRFQNALVVDGTEKMIDTKDGIFYIKDVPKPEKKQVQVQDQMGSGMSSPSTMMVPDRGHDLISAPMMPRRQGVKRADDNTPQRVGYYSDINVIGDTLQERIEVQANGKRSLTLVRLDYKDYKLAGLSRNRKTKDTSYNYRNSIIYKKKNKYGLYIGVQYSTAAIYDSILPVGMSTVLLYNDKYKESEDRNYFIVGKRSRKGKMLFGVLNEQLKETIPVKYDEILPLSRKDMKNRITYKKQDKPIRSKNKEWLVSRKNKSGLMNPDGLVFVPTIYDSIEMSQGWNDEGYRLYNLLQGGKYAYFVSRADTAIYLKKEQPFKLIMTAKPYGAKDYPTLFFLRSPYVKGQATKPVYMRFDGLLYYREE